MGTDFDIMLSEFLGEGSPPGSSGIDRIVNGNLTVLMV